MAAATPKRLLAIAINPQFSDFLIEVIMHFGLFWLAKAVVVEERAALLTSSEEKRSPNSFLSATLPFLRPSLEQSLRHGFHRCSASSVCTGFHAISC